MDKFAQKLQKYLDKNDQVVKEKQKERKKKFAEKYEGKEVHHVEGLDLVVKKLDANNGGGGNKERRIAASPSVRAAFDVYADESDDDHDDGHEKKKSSKKDERSSSGGMWKPMGKDSYQRKLMEAIDVNRAKEFERERENNDKTYKLDQNSGTVDSA